MQTQLKKISVGILKKGCGWSLVILQMSLYRVSVDSGASLRFTPRLMDDMLFFCEKGMMEERWPNN
jgi:hypothetical protein